MERGRYRSDQDTPANLPEFLCCSDKVGCARVLGKIAQVHQFGHAVLSLARDRARSRLRGFSVRLRPMAGMASVGADRGGGPVLRSVLLARGFSERLLGIRRT